MGVRVEVGALHSLCWRCLCVCGAEHRPSSWFGPTVRGQTAPTEGTALSEGEEGRTEDEHPIKPLVNSLGAFSPESGGWWRVDDVARV